MEPRYSGQEAPWNREPPLMENGLYDVKAWLGTLPADIRAVEKRHAFRREVHWVLANVHKSTGEGLFNMMYDAVIERPDPLWYWKPERRFFGRAAKHGPHLCARKLERTH